MRKELGKRYGNRIKVYGTFEKFGKKEGWKGELLTTVLLVGIRDKTGKVLTDHLWFNFTKEFQKIKNLCPGDLIRFEARVDGYMKGYKKDQFDYKLSRPSKIAKMHVDLFGDKKESVKESG